jgi:hypothetical protein
VREFDGNETLGFGGAREFVRRFRGRSGWWRTDEGGGSSRAGRQGGVGALLVTGGEG